MIRVEHVYKTFHTKTSTIQAVKDCNLTIYDHEIFGVIGYSGAGKSTLVRIINALESPDQGCVYIDDVNISALKGKALRQRRMKIGMIFQHFNLLWSRTVAGNIALPLEIAKVPKAKREARVKELLHLVGLEGRESSYPSELSGGQKQRVGIARALANEPDILLCDEATSALDPSTTESILQLLATINQTLGLTIVLITHQMEVVQKICHRIAVMSNGEIVEVGTVQDIFEQPKHEITRQFVHDTASRKSDEELLAELNQLCPQGMLVRLTFSVKISKDPIISDLMKKSPLSISIIQASLSNSAVGSFGFLVANVTGGKPEDYPQLIADFEQRGVKVEVLRDV